MRSITKFYSAACLLLGLFSCKNNNQTTLPIYGEREAIEKTVDGKTIVDTLYHTIPAFNLLNQDSVVISDKDFEGKVYIANFFFTHCPSICPTMNRNLLKIYQQYRDNEEVRFLSHSIDFKYDQPYVALKKNTQWAREYIPAYGYFIVASIDNKEDIIDIYKELIINKIKDQESIVHNENVRLNKLYGLQCYNPLKNNINI